MPIDFANIVDRTRETWNGILELRACPDQYIGMLGQLERDRRIATRVPVSSRPHEAALIVVLESPHLKEFEGDPGPAKGPTGTSLARYLREVIGLQATIDLPVILMNAVQHQCSLGKPTEQSRDKVFHAAWSDAGRACFQQRLLGVYQGGDLVACLCTKGNKRPWLRPLVAGAIQDSLPLATFVSRTHPASWPRDARSRKPLDWHCAVRTVGARLL
ncbi:hypothetical protein [Variovorax guangxiensis]|uniref:hypothetical protein n=1 Tax=Variovorax guangxiensis TaxID=1775474 RepID=UPI00112771B8|nr:hypothetical protein [Variovorax guangxiensis]